MGVRWDAARFRAKPGHCVKIDEKHGLALRILYGRVVVFCSNNARVE
jgi:hypothetical protein